MNIVPQQAPIQHDEVLGHGAIESFDVGIHLGSAGAGVKVREPEFGTGILEVFGELAPVVGLQLVDIEGANLDDSAKEVVRALYEWFVDAPAKANFRSTSTAVRTYRFTVRVQYFWQSPTVNVHTIYRKGDTMPSDWCGRFVLYQISQSSD